MALTLAELKKFMDETTNKKLDSVDSRLHQIETSVSGNAKRLDEQAASIQANAVSIRQIQTYVLNLKTGKVTTANTVLQPTTGPSGNAPSRAEDIEFARARRSLRLWPVEGQNADDLWTAAGIFLGTKLGMKGKLNKTMIEAISRVEIQSGPGVKSEALVRFVDNNTRDLVMGAAAMLAPYVNAEGKPTAGIRIEVPSHLRGDFRLLFKFGQILRTRHGKGTRRHVKFDDALGCLFLNLKLPGDATWSRVLLEVARRGLVTSEAASNEILERRLDVAGMGNARPRAASLSSSASMDVAESAWTTRRPESISS